jgi:hypothetical protein
MPDLTPHGTDPAEFQSLLARIGVPSRVVEDADGHRRIAIDRAGMTALRDWFAAHGIPDQAAAVQRALDADARP